MRRFDGNLVAVVEHIRIRILIYLIAANMPYRIHLIYAAFSQIISSNVMECSIKPSVMDTCLVEQVHIRELEEEEVKLLKNLSHLNIVFPYEGSVAKNTSTGQLFLIALSVGYAYLVVASLAIAQESATKHAISLREETCTRDQLKL
ncbi:hypothetical protein L1987_52562 [Smallanthus sonchifolius]|uniref:Uncharacterized protein n=1 Tax=Smallanthus sonchifolius TaxID=185202 RepID=A0ACB9ETF8_9ASTR|nr:hypothetical protein L1987_52562 [Smallanthus sonchifolius]